MRAMTEQTMRLYARQSEPVLAAIRRDGVCHSKKEYVLKKYGESAPIFTTAYSWFVQEAARRMPRPDGAEYPYWAFGDRGYADTSPGGGLLTLSVPVSQAVFFDRRDWEKILQLSLIGETEAEERAFSEELDRYGVDPNKVMLTPFYPELKSRILSSWMRLFRHDAAIRAGDLSGVHSVQAGLFEIRREWVTEGL